MVDRIMGTVREQTEHTTVMDLGSIWVSVNTVGINVVRGEVATLYIHVHWNNETGPQLFGFSTAAERTLFHFVLGCPGIGPKTALNIVAQLGVHTVVNAVRTGDTKVLSTISGVGIKKAEQIVVQLKHKMDKFLQNESLAYATKDEEQRRLICQVLQSLNYSPAEVASALHYLDKRIACAASSTTQLIRDTLSFLSKRS